MLIRPLLRSAVCATLAVINASPVPGARIFPDPEPCLGNCSWIHDPHIYFEGGVYYRFSTSGNIAVAAAESLTGPWTYQGAVLEHGTSIEVDLARQDIWAPNVVKFGDTYYCYYSVSFMGSQASEIGFATSSSLSPGSWTDHGSLNILQSPSYNLIDPAIFQESPEGPIYMTFGSYWEGIFSVPIPEQELVYKRDNESEGGIDLLEKTNESAPTTLTLADGLALQNLIRNTTADPDVVEGAYMFAYASQYWLFFSAGACCAVPPNLAAPGHEYRILVCKSTSPQGPFLDRDGRRCDDSGGTLVLGSHGDVYAPGGQGVMFDVKMKRHVLYYHYVKPSVGYSAEQFFFGWNYLDWVHGWPVVV